jgi:hypothetical protein
MTISDKEMAALHNLADKQAGKDVDWINIADARALTDLGLARRNRGGWEITPEGLALVKARSVGPTRTAPGDAGSPAGPAPSTDRE